MSWGRTKCVINGCSATKKKFPDLKFFEFPKKGTPKYLKWFNAAANSYCNIVNRKRPYICSKHFEPQYVREKLRRDACPTIFVDGLKFNPENANKTYERRPRTTQGPSTENKNANTTQDTSIDDQNLTLPSNSSENNNERVNIENICSNCPKITKSLLLYIKQIRKLKKTVNDLTTKINKGRKVVKYAFRREDSEITSDGKKEEPLKEASSTNTNNDVVNQTDLQTKNEVEIDEESSQTASCSSNRKPQTNIQTENIKKSQINESLDDINNVSEQNEIDPLISIKVEVEEPPSEINTSSAENISDTNVPGTLNQGQESEIKIKIEKEVDDSPIHECLVDINNVSIENEIDPLSSIKEETEEAPSRIVESSTLLSSTEAFKNSKENQDFQISDNNNVLQEDERGFDAGSRKRKRSEEHDKKDDCDKCNKLKRENDFYKKEYLSMKEKCSQVLERVKIHTAVIETTIKNDKYSITEALQALLNEKHELVEKSKESDMKLLKQIETLKAELHIYKFQHCSLKILKTDK